MADWTIYDYLPRIHFGRLYLWMLPREAHRRERIDDLDPGGRLFNTLHYGSVAMFTVMKEK